ncbi:hypothetical protein ASG41_19690 [Modestobacter sp. Leaf380]|nr:hypothetical protein ASG41_19690 [Modestobacter sp. Leaf380]
MRAVTVLVGTAVLGLLPTAASAAPLPVPGLPAVPAVPAAPAADLGFDVSHPQCDTPLPTGADFGVVGVNGGVATTVNPCLVDQLRWADSTTGDVPGQPALQVYVNTANPGHLQEEISTWPRSGDSPYGPCTGANDTACSWVYGQIRASVDIHGFLLPAARAAGVDVVPAELVWWLDVETMNTWQSGSAAALAANRAALEGMHDYLATTGARVGLYSTSQQWQQIVGLVPPGSSLYELDSWLAGALSRSEAQLHCADAPLVAGGSVVLSQYVVERDGRPLDHDLPC